MQETQVPSLGQEDALEKEMATHSSILAWKIPWTEEPGGLQSMGSQTVRQDRVTEHSVNFYSSLGVHLKCQFLKKCSLLSNPQRPNLPRKSLCCDQRGYKFPLIRTLSTPWALSFVAESFGKF